MESIKPTSDFRYIDIESVDNKENIIKCAKQIKLEKAPSRATRKLWKGDILFSTVRPYLKNIAIVTEEYSDCIASTGFYICKPMNFLDSEFLYYFLLSPYLIDGVMPFMRGENSPSIRNDYLEKMIIGIPSLQEQKKIVEKIKSINNQISDLF